MYNLQTHPLPKSKIKQKNNLCLENTCRKIPSGWFDLVRNLKVTHTLNLGALDGGSKMSHVKFKLGQCPLLLILQFPCEFKNNLMLHVIDVLMSCHKYFSLCQWAPCHLLIFRNGCVAMSNP